MKPFFVYILKCADGTYYTGHTDNLEFRLSQHENRTMKGFTSRRLPVKLVFYEQFESRDAAFAAERKLKNWSRKKKELLIQRHFQALRIAAKKRF